MFTKSRIRVALCFVWLIVSSLARPAGAQAPLPNPSVASTAGFKVSGTVVNALNGAPLGQARVTLTDVQNRSRVFLSMVTSENGHFEFTSLPTGKFSLTGARRGFIRAAYDQHDQFSTAIVTGAGLSTENLILRLPPLADISGKVIDEAGAPVRDAQIILYSRGKNDGLNRIVRVNSATTDDQGAYELTSLGAGMYFVSAWAKPWYAVHPPHAENSPPPVVDSSLDVVYATTFYNGATDGAAATAISIKPGDHALIDLHFIPIPALRVIVRMPPAGNGQQPGMFPELIRREMNVPQLVDAQPQQVSEGVFELAGVPPGRYSVLIPSPGATAVQAGELNLRSNGQEVDLTRTEAVASLNITLKLPGDAPLAQRTYVVLRNSQARSGADSGSQDIFASGKTDFAGTISLPTVVPGKYSLLVGSGTIPYTVTRTVAEGRESTGHEITVTPGSSQDITAYLTPGLVSVQGVVKRGGKPVPGAMVVLVPTDPIHHPEFFRRDQSDFDGSFVLPGVIPGGYSIIALENAWDLPWGEPGALTPYLAKSQALTVGSLMQRTVVLPEAIEAQLR